MELEQKELSYEATKAVMKFMSLRNREKIDSCIPSLKKTNTLLPYCLDFVEIDESSFEVNEKIWRMHPPLQQVEGYPLMMRPVPDQENTTVVRFEVGEYKVKKIIEKPTEELIEKLADLYLRSAARIERLSILRLPIFFEDKDPATCQLQISELELSPGSFETFQVLRPFVEKSVPLKKIRLNIRQDELPMFEDPFIFTSDTVTLDFPEFNPVPLNGTLMDLKNPHIEMAYHNFPVEKIQELITKWQESRRPVGNTFILGIRESDFIPTVFEHLKEHLGAESSKIPALGNQFFANAVTIPIDAESEIVVHSGPKHFKKRYQRGLKWSLKIEVMTRGTTIVK